MHAACAACGEASNGEPALHPPAYRRAAVGRAAALRQQQEQPRQHQAQSREAARHLPQPIVAQYIRSVRGMLITDVPVAVPLAVPVPSFVSFVVIIG